MTGKAKPKKHTAKEIAALTNRDGGKAELADRAGKEKGGHAKFECPLCKVTAPDIKSMQIHHEARHPKIPFEEDKVNNIYATTVSEASKTKPGIRGSLKKALSVKPISSPVPVRLYPIISIFMLAIGTCL